MIKQIKKGFIMLILIYLIKIRIINLFNNMFKFNAIDNKEFNILNKRLININNIRITNIFIWKKVIIKIIATIKDMLI